MRHRALQLIVVACSVALASACGGNNRSPEPGAQGTAGSGNPDARDTASGSATTQGAASKSAGTLLTGCLEKNLRSGQFELVLEAQGARHAGDANAGLQPGHDRLELIKEGSVELNQYVGKRVTLEGRSARGSP